MAKRTFLVTLDDHMFEDKSQERLQKDIYIGVEEYLLYTGNLKDGYKPEDGEAILNMRVREEKQYGKR